jgi:hypothetical protein
MGASPGFGFGAFFVFFRTVTSSPWGTDPSKRARRPPGDDFVEGLPRRAGQLGRYPLSGQGDVVGRASSDNNGRNCGVTEPERGGGLRQCGAELLADAGEGTSPREDFLRCGAVVERRTVGWPWPGQ